MDFGGYLVENITFLDSFGRKFSSADPIWLGLVQLAPQGPGWQYRVVFGCGLGLGGHFYCVRSHYWCVGRHFSLVL